VSVLGNALVGVEEGPSPTTITPSRTWTWTSAYPGWAGTTCPTKQACLCIADVTTSPTPDPGSASDAALAKNHIGSFMASTVTEAAGGYMCETTGVSEGASQESDMLCRRGAGEHGVAMDQEHRNCRWTAAALLLQCYPSCADL
jgi:hypothetical protein